MSAEYVWLIPSIPMISALSLGFFGKFFSRRFVSFVACTSILLSSVLVTLLVVKMAFFDSKIIEEIFTYRWIDLDKIKVNVGFLVDPLSLSMMLVVTWVGFIIHCYSVKYMSDDRGYSRFFAELNLFVVFMVILVLADNLVLMFVGWEGVGLCSYLLIGYWYEKGKATAAAQKAFVINRIGDLGFIIGACAVFHYFGTFNLLEVNYRARVVFEKESLELAFIALAFILAATGKSAQVPLFTWLPDAMEAPTPVSALIHAATMVTAGVYLLIRLNAIYLLSPSASTVMAIIGMATAFFAATCAFTQYDIKKVLAYSTISQLGYMFTACGAGAYVSAIYHLINHAFYKALLFLGAGNIIHMMDGELDIRKMGGLKKNMKITFICFVIGSLSLAGIPPLSGFFSKDEILVSLLLCGNLDIWIKYLLWFFGVLTSVITASYIARLVLIVFYGDKGGNELYITSGQKESMLLSVISLSFLTIFSVILAIKPTGSISILEGWLKSVIFYSFKEISGSHSNYVNITMFTSIIASLIGILIAYNIYGKYYYNKNDSIGNRYLQKLHVFINSGYKIDYFYNRFFAEQTLFMANIILLKRVELGVTEGIVKVIVSLIDYLGMRLRRLHSGHIKDYALGIIVGLMLMLAVVLAT